MKFRLDLDRKFILEIKFIIVSPKFGCGFLLILKQGFVPHLKFKSFDFSFIGFLVLSAFRGYLILKISSSFDLSI